MSPPNTSQVVLNLRLIQLQRLYFVIRITQNPFIRKIENSLNFFFLKSTQYHLLE